LINRLLVGVLFALLLSGNLVAIAQEAAAPSGKDGCPEFEVLEKAIGELREELFQSVEPALLPFEQTCVGNPAFLYALGRLRFLRGEYGQAQEILSQAALVATDPLLKRVIAHDMKLASDTAGLTAGYRRVVAPELGFILLHAPGRDEVLVPYIKDIFPRIRDSIGSFLGYSAKRPVRIEIFEDPQGLAAASELTEEEIETSGTIALAKYGKLMLVSPKAMARGYGWMDTLAHEYVHYVIQQQTGTKVPIWIHEAFAKYLQTRWRSEKSLPMRPSSQHLLKQALKKGDLVTFDEMSPSMAKLPSMERTGLAFAEVYTVAQYLESKVGPEGMRALIQGMAGGQTDREALKSVLGKPFSGFYRDWKRFLRKQRWQSVPAGVLELRVFKSRHDPEAELREIGEKKAEDFTYLGDLLKARDRNKAAVVEYQKASKRTKGVNPTIQAKYSDALLRTGDAPKALKAVEAPLSHYPEHVLLQLNRGKALILLGRHDEAVEALNHALRINPFDVEIHSLLVEIFERKGDQKSMDIETTALKILQQDPTWERTR